MSFLYYLRHLLDTTDTVPLESITSWLTCLRTEHPTLPFRASSAFLPVAEPAIKSKGNEKASVNDAIGASSILAYLSECAQEKEGDEPVTVAIVGLTNVSVLCYRCWSTKNLVAFFYRLVKAH